MPELKSANIEIGVLIVVTAEPGALSEASKLSKLATPWADAMFLLENRMRGVVDAKQLSTIANGAVITAFDEQIMEAKAVEIFQDRGLRDIANIEPASLTQLHGLALDRRDPPDRGGNRRDFVRGRFPFADTFWNGIG